ncbi:AAA family ATPase [Amycolatopsis samaneae]|uniref:AAA family ATPase n=1 Tax=Amycolatopsis samaneae TaxID=664691 RepID=A0ABW5GC92_9PSEU
MIVWLNGTFGAGKTTTARELVARLPEARIFDAEHVGFLLRTVLPEPPGDFQHLPPWRPLVVETATRILRYAGGTLIVPQTVLVEAYAREIFDGLAENDVPVRHFALHADRPELVRRIEGDTVEPEHARQWRLEHLDRYTEALPWLRRSATIVDTQGKTAEVVAAEIAAQLIG